METGDRRQETGGRKQETGGRKQECNSVSLERFPEFRHCEEYCGGTKQYDVAPEEHRLEGDNP